MCFVHALWVTLLVLLLGLAVRWAWRKLKNGKKS